MANDIITYTWQCEKCLQDNHFDAPAAPYIIAKETCEHCGAEQMVEGVVDGQPSSEFPLEVLERRA